MFVWNLKEHLEIVGNKSLLTAINQGNALFCTALCDGLFLYEATANADLNKPMVISITLNSPEVRVGVFLNFLSCVKL